MPHSQVSDGGFQVGPIAVEHEPWAVLALVQRYGPQLFGAFGLTAVLEKLTELGPAQVNGLFVAVSLVEAVSRQPCELKRDSVIPLVQAKLCKGIDISYDDSALALEPVELAVGNIDLLRGLFHAWGCRSRC